MTTLHLSSAPAPSLKVDALVLGVAKGPGGLVLASGADSIDEAFGGRLVKTLATLRATGSECEITRLATLGATAAGTVVAVGLGDVPPPGQGYEPETLRRAAGAAVRSLAGTAKVATTLSLVNGDNGGDNGGGGNGGAAAAVRAVAEGALLGGYAFTRYRHTSRSQHKNPVSDVTLSVANPRSRTVTAAVRRAEVVGRAVALARDLVNTPAADLHPRDLAAVAEAEGARAGLTVEVLDEKALKKGGYGGILGVGAGALHPPCLVRMAYTHPKATRSVALVGKGITFDSGGLSIKPAGAMETMKCDMSGAAAVLAALAAVAALEPEVNVTGWLPTAENMPGGAAIRPSDVLTMYGGTRVEVRNTDAEGRLVLGDALARASEDRPDYVLDVATLTGAQMIALGTRTTGVMANDDTLRGRVVDAADRAGEPMWPMPLPAELRKGLDSDIADLANVAPAGDRNGGMLRAGIFLREFVGDGVRWAHLDIAGPAYNSGDAYGYTPKGGTGAAVRTLVEFVEDVAAG